MFSLQEPPLFTRLRKANRILVAGAGGGFDVYAGLPLALSALTADGSFLGAFSIPRDSREAALYLDAVEYAQAATPAHPSIVNGSIAAALQGRFGDVRFTTRTRNSELFINPLMAVYFAVDLDGLARRSLYLDRLRTPASSARSAPA